MFEFIFNNYDLVAEVYEQLAKQLKDNKDIVIAEYDASANENENVSIEKYPTIKLYLANKKSDPIIFNG